MTPDFPLGAFRQAVLPVQWEEGPESHRRLHAGLSLLGEGAPDAV